MRFWTTKQHEELVFDADSTLDHTIIAQPLANCPIMLSRSSSTASTSDASDYLTQDPMHEADKSLSLKPNPSHASLARSINSVALDSLAIGDMTADDVGLEWVVRQCFCDHAACPGKAFWRVDGKDELNVWDRWKPRPDETSE